MHVVCLWSLSWMSNLLLCIESDIVVKVKMRIVQGVQFHPESIITAGGMTIVRNFVKLIERKEAAELEN